LTAVGPADPTPPFLPVLRKQRPDVEMAAVHGRDHFSDTKE
jgi:hypothetical protein